MQTPAIYFRFPWTVDGGFSEPLFSSSSSSFIISSVPVQCKSVCICADMEQEQDEEALICRDGEQVWMNGGGRW